MAVGGGEPISFTMAKLHSYDEKSVSFYYMDEHARKVRTEFLTTSFCFSRDPQLLTIRHNPKSNDYERCATYT